MNARTILGAVVLGMGLVGACSTNDADDDEPAGGASEANEAGSGGSGEAGGGGGTGGAEAGSGGVDEGCQAQALAALCELEDCPDNLESVVLICGGLAGDPKRWTTRCGGTAVSNPVYSGYVYFFNEQDELVGAQHFDNEPGKTCVDHGLIVSETFGTTCALQEPAAKPCEELCPTQPLAAWCDEQSCPSEADAARDCSTRPETREVWDNDCGGVNVSEASNGYGGTTWSFDAAGQLVGVLLSTDIPFYCNELSFSQTYGSFCDFVGTSELICTDGGVGGAGN